MNPVFVHDPRRGTTLHEWFDLEGNPDPDKTWASMTLEYVDDEGNLQLLEAPLTPAHFALGEGRFFTQAVPAAAPTTRRPPCRSTSSSSWPPRTARAARRRSSGRRRREAPGQGRGVPSSIVALVEERRRNWQLLQYLAGQHVSKLSACTRPTSTRCRRGSRRRCAQRESSLDDIARAMSELAASDQGAGRLGATIPRGSAGFGSGRAGHGRRGRGDRGRRRRPIVFLDEADQKPVHRLQDLLPGAARAVREDQIVVDGEALDVARMIPGASSTRSRSPRN